jgi:hypothetical protein
MMRGDANLNAVVARRDTLLNSTLVVEGGAHHD